MPWPAEQSFADFLRGLDASIPTHAAVLAKSTVLLRGSGYAAFDGDVPEHPRHAGIGAPYAHTTAPLRRLVDRYVGEVCLAVSAGTDVPDWVRAALPDLPETMEDSNRRQQGFESGIVSLVEAAVLAGSVGQVFEAVVVDADKDGEGGSVQLRKPAVTARCSGSDLLSAASMRASWRPTSSSALFGLSLRRRGGTHGSPASPLLLPRLRVAWMWPPGRMNRPPAKGPSLVAVAGPGGLACARAPGGAGAPARSVFSRDMARRDGRDAPCP